MSIQTVELLLPIVADSFEALRACDVYRLVSAIVDNPANDGASCCDAIVERRPDLAETVADALADLAPADETGADDVDAFEWSATYCLDDNKLRLTFEGLGRFSDDDKNAIKGAGYRWASKQEVYVCPRWTVAAENMALQLAGYIGDESYGPEERAADRAERFAGYRDKRASEAGALADSFEAGPAVHGYQNQHKAERAAARHNRQRVNAVNQWNKAEYWQRRTAGVISSALYKSRPDVRRRRILKLEKLQRKHLQGMTEARESFARWLDVLNWNGSEADQTVTLDSDGNRGDMNDAQKLAYRATSLHRASDCVEHPEYPGFFAGPHAALVGGTFTNRGRSEYVFFDSTGERDESHARLFTPREIAAAYIGGRSSCFNDDSTAQRWANHYANRLAFENAMLENEGGKLSEVDIVPGGWIRTGAVNSRSVGVYDVDGWAQVLKVNKSPATKRVTSVDVAGWSLRYDAATNDQKRTDCRRKLNIESSGADVYRAPTAEELAAFKAKTKAAKAAAKKNAPAKPKLLNLDTESAQRLQDLWNARALASVEAYNAKSSTGSAKKTFKPSEILELTQKQYSANSKGSYAKFETCNVMDHGSMYSRGDSCETVALRVRWASGSGFAFSARRVIVLTDKPRKPAPLNWSTIEGKSKIEATEALKPAPKAAAPAGQLF